MSRFSNFLFGAVALVGLTSAASANVTFILSIDDNGSGVDGVPVSTPGAFALYAQVSGANAGLASFSVHVTGATTMEVDAPNGTYVKKQNR